MCQTFSASWNIVEKERTSSTMEDCKAIVTPGKTAAVIAKSQSSGVGRRGNEWSSPEGGLYVTFGWSVRKPLREWTGLSLAVGVSLIESLGLSKEGVGLKWPNDIVEISTKRKLGGVLIQLSESNGATQVLVGLGMNCKPIDLPEAVSLEEITGDRTTPMDIFNRIADKMDSTIMSFAKEGFTGFRERWMSYCVHNGNEVTLARESDPITGIFKGVAEDGSLLLKTHAGIERFQSGHVLEW